MTRALFLPALLAVAGVSGSALAGDGVWTLTGPVGGEVQSLATDPGDPKALYAGTAAGVFESVDGADGWSLRASGFGVREVSCVAASSSPPRTIYAGTARSEVYRSTDDGLTWASRTAGLPERCWVARVVVDPRTPLVLYAVLANSWHPVYKSTDGGGSWFAASAGVPGWPFLLPGTLALDSADANSLYLATTSGVFVSPSGGGSWSAKNQGLPPGPVSGVAVLPTQPRTLLAAVVDRLNRSVDGAESWSALGTAGGRVEVVAVDSRVPAWVFVGLGSNAGVRRSTDGGLTFGPASLAGESVHDLLFDRDAVSTLYAASDSGVWKSTDAGASFASSSTGLLAPLLRELAVSPSQPAWLYTVGGTSSDRIHRSTDGGATFEDATGNLPSAGPFRSLAVHPTDPMTVFLAGPFEGAAKTTDGGASWGTVGIGLPGPADLIAVHTGSPNILLAGFSSTPPFRSTDGGATWSFAGAGIPGGVRSLALHPTDPDAAWAGGLSAAYRTTDGGAHWSPSAAQPNDPFHAIVVDPLDPSRLFASSFSGVYGSEDSGATWTRINGSLPASHRGSVALALDPSSPSHLFYATVSPPAVVYRSLDGGRSWIRAGLEGLAVTGPLAAAAGTVRAATAGGLASLTGAITFGDLNVDSAVDVFDVVALASHIVGNVVNGQAPFLGPLAVADENRDFLVDVFDLVLLQAFIVGNVPSLPQ